MHVSASPYATAISLLEGENERRTSGIKFLAVNHHLDVGLVSFRVLRTARQEPSSDKLIHAFIVSCEVASVRGGMDRWVRFIVSLALTRRGEITVA